MRAVARLDEVRFVPVGTPAHRAPPVAEKRLRARLLRAAVAGIDGFTVDERELERCGPSYTVDTLDELRHERPDVAWCLIIGMDQFLLFDQWHRWRAILGAAHLCVAQRPGTRTQLPAGLETVLSEARIDDAKTLRALSHGCIFIGQLPVLDISSTRIRALLAADQDPRFLLPDPVLELIKLERLYEYDE